MFLSYVFHIYLTGKDAYEAAQALGKYLTIPRTEGISTTDIVGRILRHIKGPESASAAGEVGKVRERSPLFNKRSNFLTTGRVVRQFSDNAQPPAAGARVVYIAGTWDLLHAGHLSLLEKSLAHGDYLIVVRVRVCVRVSVKVMIILITTDYSFWIVLITTDYNHKS
jgi:ethanolamine-phosphate cytidylyltransferase